METNEQKKTRVILWMAKRIKELEDRLFVFGAMDKPPCFVCGYNGANYYQPDQHPCAERHHRLCKRHDGGPKLTDLHYSDPIAEAE